MRTDMHPNSIRAYHDIKLSKRQAEIVQAFMILGEATDQKIADYLNYTSNRITGRITELQDKGVVVEDHSVIGQFGKPVRVCRLREFKETFLE